MENFLSNETTMKNRTSSSILDSYHMGFVASGIPCAQQNTVSKIMHPKPTSVSPEDSFYSAPSAPASPLQLVLSGSTSPNVSEDDSELMFQSVEDSLCNSSLMDNVKKDKIWIEENFPDFIPSSRLDLKANVSMNDKPCCTILKGTKNLSCDTHSRDPFSESDRSPFKVIEFWNGEDGMETSTHQSLLKPKADSLIEHNGKQNQNSTQDSDIIIEDVASDVDVSQKKEEEIRISWSERCKNEIELALEDLSSLLAHKISLLPKDRKSSIFCSFKIKTMLDSEVWDCNRYEFDIGLDETENSNFNDRDVSNSPKEENENNEKLEDNISCSPKNIILANNSDENTTVSSVSKKPLLLNDDKHPSSDHSNNETNCCMIDQNIQESRVAKKDRSKRKNLKRKRKRHCKPKLQRNLFSNVQNWTTCNSRDDPSSKKQKTEEFLEPTLNSKENGITSYIPMATSHQIQYLYEKIEELTRTVAELSRKSALKSHDDKVIEPNASGSNKTEVESSSQEKHHSMCPPSGKRISHKLYDPCMLVATPPPASLNGCLH